MHLIKSWGFPVCHSFQLLFYCISCYTDVWLLWNAFLLCPLLTQPLSIAVVLNRLVPHVAAEFSGFCCIWNHLCGLFLTTKLLKELLLVCFELSGSLCRHCLCWASYHQSPADRATSRCLTSSVATLSPFWLIFYSLLT